MVIETGLNTPPAPPSEGVRVVLLATAPLGVKVSVVACPTTPVELPEMATDVAAAVVAMKLMGDPATVRL
jgi:hypothetical protein